MSIVFQCGECQKRLKVAEAKAGTSAKCPACGNRVTVPQPQPVSSAPPPIAPAAPPASNIEGPPAAPDVPAEGPPIVIEDAPRSGTRASTPQIEIDPEQVTFTRRVVYAQGILIATVGVLAFIVGYFIGVADKASDDGVRAQGRPSGGPVQVEGTLTYRAGGNARADSGAVVLMLPAGGYPDEKVDPSSLRPSGGSSDSPALRVLESLGGHYLKADGQGRFEATLPSGDYHVVRVSASAKRSGAASRQQLQPAAKYFHPVEDLVGDREFDVTTITLDADRDLSLEF